MLKTPKMPKMPILMFMLTCFCTVFSGCAASEGVAAGTELKTVALTNFLVGDAKIDNAVLGMWEVQRDREVRATAEAVALDVASKVATEHKIVDEEGKVKVTRLLTVDQAAELAGAITDNVQKQNAMTRAIKAKIKTVRDFNMKNLLQHQKLERAIVDYMNAGVDSSVLSELQGVLIDSIKTLTSKERENE